MLDILRMLSMFNPAGMMGGQGMNQGMNQPDPFQNQMNQPNPQEDFIKSLLTPQNTAGSQLNSMMGNMPKRENYQPGKFRTIAAAIAGLGSGGPLGIAGGQPIGYKSNVPEGLKIQEHIKDEPYDRAVGDWGMKLKPIMDLAQTEKAQNTNNRLIGTQLLKDQNADEEHQRKVTADANRVKTEEDKLAQKDRYLEFKRYQQSHPDHKYMVDDEGLVYSVDPQTNKVEYLEKDGDPITSKDLPDHKKLELQHNNRMSEIEAQGKNAVEAAKVRGDESRKTKLVPSPNKTGSSSKAQSATQELTAQYLKAREALMKHPEWKDYITVDPSKKSFDVHIPKGMFGYGKGDPQVAQQVLDEIYGKGAMSANVPTLPNSASKGQVVGDPDRDKAVDMLKKAGKPLTAENIDVVTKRLKEKK